MDKDKEVALGLKDYKKLVQRTMPSLGTATVRVTGHPAWVVDLDYDHMVSGVATELLEELVLAIKKKDTINIGEELADAEWYLCNLATHLGMRLADKYDDILGRGIDHAENLLIHTGRLLDYHKKALAYGRDMPKKQVIKDSIEAILEAIQHTAATYGVNLPVMRGRVIAKLYKRYPDKFDADKAIIRDLGVERAVLEGGK